VLLPSAGKRPSTLEIPASEIWDASPDGRSLITVEPGHLTFIHLISGHPTNDVRSFGTGGILGDGSWSAGSGLIAAALRKPDGSSRLVLVSEEKGTAPIAGTEGAMGNVVWNAAGDRFAYVSVATGNRSHLQANVCSLAGSRRVTCRPWFKWLQGIALLQLDSP
jgi:hypothetical protein